MRTKMLVAAVVVVLVMVSGVAMGGGERTKDMAPGAGQAADLVRGAAPAVFHGEAEGAGTCDRAPRIRRPSEVGKIATEQPNGVAERVYFHYGDPDVAMRSYSCADVSGCTGTMIGPNVMLTAGHCGSGNRNATFRLYTAPTTQMTEGFFCRYLTHTFGDMDLNAYWCDPNPAGENPGDKFGYADPDIIVNPATGELDYAGSAALVTAGKPVYSVWMNPIDDIGGGWHSIYSEGTISVTGAPNHWGSPNLNVAADFRCGNSCCDNGIECTGNCDTGSCGSACTTGSCVRRATRSVAVGTNLWTNPGASGSGQFSSATHRYLVGPQSVGSLDGPDRGGLALVDHLYWGYTDPNLTCPTCCQNCLDDQINTSLMQSLGVANPSQYDGYVDYIGGVEDGLLDVQQAVEIVRGENPRGWYWLGFESLRRNELWTKYLDVEFDVSDPVAGIATIDSRGYPAGGLVPALEHERLNLPTNRYFDVGLATYVIEQGATPVLFICLGTGVGSDCREIDPPPLTWTRHVFRLWGSPGADLGIAVQGDSIVRIADISVIEHGAVMDFDSHDKRFSWRNANNGERGLIWPNGVDSPTAPDWAGVISRDPDSPLDDDWSLSNRQLAINGGEQYKVCFKYRSSGRIPLYAAWGTVRMVDEAGEVPGSKFFVDPQTSWGSACTSWFGVPTDQNELQFGVYAFIPGSSGAYLVDDVEVRSESLFADDFELGNLDRWPVSVGR